MQERYLLEVQIGGDIADNLHIADMNLVSVPMIFSFLLSCSLPSFMLPSCLPSVSRYVSLLLFRPFSPSSTTRSTHRYAPAHTHRIFYILNHARSAEQGTPSSQKHDREKMRRQKKRGEMRDC